MRSDKSADARKAIVGKVMEELLGQRKGEAGQSSKKARPKKKSKKGPSSAPATAEPEPIAAEPTAVEVAPAPEQVPETSSSSGPATALPEVTLAPPAAIPTTSATRAQENTRTPDSTQQSGSQNSGGRDPANIMELTRDYYGKNTDVQTREITRVFGAEAIATASSLPLDIVAQHTLRCATLINLHLRGLLKRSRDFDNSERTLSERQAQISRLNEESAQLKGQVQNLTEENISLRSQVQSLTEINANLTSDLKLAEDAKVQAWEGNKKTREELDAAREENNRMKAELAKMEAEKEEHIAEVQTVNRKLELAEMDLRQTREDHLQLAKASKEKEKELEDELLHTWVKGWASHRLAAEAAYPNLEFDFSPPGDEDQEKGAESGEEVGSEEEAGSPTM